MERLDTILRGASSLKPPGNLGPAPVSARDWEEAVGSRIARRTQPVRLDRGTLHVRVANAAWANELSLLADDILAQLVARGLVVSALRFTVGAIDRLQATTPRGPIRRAARADAELPEPLRERVAAVPDADLRAALAAAAAKTMSLYEPR